MKKVRNPKFFIPLLIIIFLAAFPLFRPSIYLLSFLFTVFMYIALALSWNIIGGYAGYLSFGHVAFFGIGGYTTALLLKNLGLSPFYTAPAGGLLAAVLAVVAGYPCLRLRGPYFALVTLCLALAVHVVALNVGWTKGAEGFWLPALPVNIFTDRAIFYETMLVLMLIIIFVVRWVEKSKLGIGLVCIREDEEVSQTIGINATVLKILAFALSAFLTGIVGGIYSYYRTYIHPSIMFDTFISITIVLMALFGGSRFWIGPLVGAGILSVVSELLTIYIGAEIARILFGFLLAVVILFMPDGLMAYVRRPSKVPT